MAKFKVPVEWLVCDYVEVEANSFEEAIKYVVDNRDDIPLGTKPEYVDGSYRINSEDDTTSSEWEGENFIRELTELLLNYGYGKEV